MTTARPELERLAGCSPAEIDEDIFDLSSVKGAAHYDRIGRLYDTVIATKVYNRALWKTSPSRYRAFATEVFQSRKTGLHLEIGCGALQFTSHLYEADRGRPIVLIDQSLEMLRMARARLTRKGGRLPPNIVLARGDIRTLRLTPGIATTALAMLVLHVLDEPEVLLRVLSGVSRDTDSTIGLTSLFRAGGRGDVFLSLLHAARELSVPRSLATLDTLVAANIPGRGARETDGCMAFFMVTR